MLTVTRKELVTLEDLKEFMNTWFEEVYVCFGVCPEGQHEILTVSMAEIEYAITEMRNLVGLVIQYKDEGTSLSMETYEDSFIDDFGEEVSFVDSRLIASFKGTSYAFIFNQEDFCVEMLDIENKSVVTVFCDDTITSYKFLRAIGEISSDNVYPPNECIHYGDCKDYTMTLTTVFTPTEEGSNAKDETTPMAPEGTAFRKLPESPEAE